MKTHAYYTGRLGVYCVDILEDDVVVDKKTLFNSIRSDAWVESVELIYSVSRKVLSVFIPFEYLKNFFNRYSVALSQAAQLELKMDIDKILNIPTDDDLEENTEVAPTTLVDEVNDALGLERVIVNIPKEVTEKLKVLAEEKDMGFQEYIRFVLTMATE